MTPEQKAYSAILKGKLDTLLNATKVLVDAHHGQRRIAHHYGHKGD